VKIYALDPKLSHQNNPNCPMRLMRDANGVWYCADCRLRIMERSFEVQIVQEGVRENWTG